MLLLLKIYCIHCWSGLSLDLLAPKRAICLGGGESLSSDTSLTTKSVECTSLAFESVDHVHGCHCLSFGVLGVGHSIVYDVLKEDLQHAASFLVD